MIALKAFSIAIAGIASFPIQVAAHGLIEGYTVNGVLLVRPSSPQKSPANHWKYLELLARRRVEK